MKNYRWFEKTEVSKGKVYGLLNRRTLFVWDSEVGDCLRRLDISESPPGMGESNLVRIFLLITSPNVKFHSTIICQCCQTFFLICTPFPIFAVLLESSEYTKTIACAKKSLNLIAKMAKKMR